MKLDHLVLLPLAIGHITLFVLIVNVVHALGHRGTIANGFKIALLSGFSIGSAILAWEACHGAITFWSWPSLIYGTVCVITGLFLLPLSTSILHLRDQPGGIQGHDTTLDLAQTEGLENLVGPGRFGFLLRLPGNQSLQLCKIECDVTIAGLPSALDGLSILHLSDVHLAPSYARRYFEMVFEEARSLPADIVVFTGDLVDDDGAIDWVVPLFTKLRGKLGNFSILGNHDLEHSPGRLCQRLEEAGFTDLEGRWSSIKSSGVTLALGGTSFPWGPALPIADRPLADFRILLSHAPDRFYWAEKNGFDLMLSGHNHGGQVRLPLIGAIFMPSLYSRRFDRGFFRRGKLTLHVSQGVGGKHPIRYGCPPEITRIVLKAAVPIPNHTTNSTSSRQSQISI